MIGPSWTQVRNSADCVDDGDVPLESLDMPANLDSLRDAGRATGARTGC